MAAQSELRPWETLREIVHSGNPQVLEKYVESLNPGEAVRAMFRLDREDQGLVLTMLSPTDAAELVDGIPDEHAADIIERLTASDAAAILNEMNSDDQADVLGEMDRRDAEAILAEMEPSEARDARRLLTYAEDRAGGLMITEFVALPERTTAGDAIKELGRLSETDEEYYTQNIYVISAGGRLIGVVALNKLVQKRQDTRIDEIMSVSPYVSPDMSLEDLEEFLEKHDLAAVPVIDDNVRLIGLVTGDAVAEALAARAETDLMKMQGIVGGDEIRSMPLLQRSGRRLSWLSINIVLNLISASVIALYADTVHAVIALAVFLPIVSDMSGCSGNQAVAVSLRELALGIVKPFEFLRVWLKESSVGLINGAALGVLLGGVAWLWKGNPYLGLVVGGALFLNTIVAVSVGGVVPLLLKRFHVDPAVASGPILTTITDMCGFFLVLSLATAMLPLLALD
jgi:magnesium transporter